MTPAARRLMGVLEAVTAATRDGTYRFAAHKAMSCLLHQNPATLRDGYLKPSETAPYIVLASLRVDDSIAPVEPPSGVRATTRREPARYPHRDKRRVGRFLKDLDPDPDRAHLCCNWVFTDCTIPDTLVFQSGWNPGDWFVRVELAPTTFPFNAGGILGMNRWGAPFTQVVTSKGDTPENRLQVTDLSDTADRRYLPDRDRIDELWEPGRMPDTFTGVPVLQDTTHAAFARVDIQNPEGLPLRLVQEYIFVKNRLFVRRETAIWNTQNVGPFVGCHWANTFIGAPVASHGQIAMNTPPADLLVWFSPQPGCRMQVVDRTAEDPRTAVCTAQVRHAWEGTPSAGQRLHSTQVYHPHTARKALPVSNNPGQKGTDRSVEFARLAGASAIQVVRDGPDATVLRLEFEPGFVEWVGLNPDSQTLRVGSGETAEPWVYRREATP